MFCKLYLGLGLKQRKTFYFAISIDMEISPTDSIIATS